MSQAFLPVAARCRVVPAFLALVAFLLLASPSSYAAETAYEPNDSPISAAGPLALGGAYAASIEKEGDRDFFFFYVTSASAAKVELTATNLGGGSSTSELDATILDSAATPIASQTYIGVGTSRTVAATLGPAKYYVEVVGGKGLGATSYSLTAGGGAGAFGPYADIAARCANATKAASDSESALSRAEAKLQRTIARLRRARYGTPNARTSARRAHRKARARLRSKQRAADSIAERQGLWCSVPQ